ncbi:hypothetical protein A8V38_13890 [Vibrio parahaemolyticus]|nr:hypothetical protein [Vibrio parahaemolyticus]
MTFPLKLVFVSHVWFWSLMSVLLICYLIDQSTQGLVLKTLTYGIYSTPLIPIAALVWSKYDGFEASENESVDVEKIDFDSNLAAKSSKRCCNQNFKSMSIN